MADQPELWGFKRTARVVVPATLAVGLVAFLMFSRGEQLKVSNAKGGECIVAPTETVVNVVQQRDCDDAHDAEIVGTVDQPANVGADQPSPEENCTRLPEGLTPAELTYYQEVMERLIADGYPSMIVRNNPDPAKRHEYLCLITFPSRTGSYVQEVLEAVAAEVPAPG
jgi:hypothetical protein